MTLVVTLRGTDGQVIAADSRGTIGDPRGVTAIDDTHVKLFQLTKFSALGISGASELATAFVETLNKEITARTLLYFDEVLEVARSIARRSYDDWFSKFPLMERPTMLLVFTGFNADSDVPPKTCILSSTLDFAPQLFASGNALAGIVQYAVYLLHRFYDPGMTTHQLKRLAVYLIGETASQDPKVGGPIRMAVISRERGYEEVPADEIKAIVSENERQSQAMKEFFMRPPHETDLSQV